MYMILALVAFGILMGIIWRLFSRRIELPCPSWLHWMVELDNPFTKINRASVIIEQMLLEPGMIVLDAGCGPGRLTIPLAQKIGPQGSVTALDLQEEMLQRVEAKAKALDLQNIQYLQAGLGEGKLARDHYDRAVLATVLGEIPDRERALKELYVALKPGASLFVTEFIFDPHFQRQKTVLTLSQAVGFQLKGCSGSWFAYTMQLKKPTKF